MKTYLYLIFIIFSFYVYTNEIDWTMNYSEFQTELQSFNIKSKADYIQFFMTEGKDLGFPSTRQIPQIYSDEWKDWNDLFGTVQDNSPSVSSKNSKTSFITYKVFISLMKADGIDNHENYQVWYEENQDIFNVPRHPEEVYPEFKDWKVLQEASPQPHLQNEPHQAMQRPVQQPITGSKLNKQKKRTTKKIQKKRQRQYLSYTELQTQVQKLGITIFIEYEKRYKEIPGAPARPDRIYPKEWKDWPTFLGTIPQRKRHYPSYTELQIQVQALSITTRKEYEKRYKEIPNAPSRPDHIYTEEWKGWHPFLGTNPQRKKHYPSYTELQIQVQALGITTRKKYGKRYNEIPNAPSRPDQIYTKEWKGWYPFLGTRHQRKRKRKRKQQYLSYTELQIQVQALGITSSDEYLNRYKEIPKAPSHPDQIYTKEWKGWYPFLGTRHQRKRQKYPSYTELQIQVQALSITTRTEYEKRYKEIPGAPSNPNQIYTKEWKGWPPFLGTGPQRQRPYLSYIELQIQVQKLGIVNRKQYRSRYKEIPGAPADPVKKYPKEWKNWPTFLQKKDKKCMEQFRLEKIEH